MMQNMMRAWAVDTPGPIDDHPLREVERPIPAPGLGQIRIRVRACGVCRTDLHLAEGDLVQRHPLVVPGHEVVGVVDQLGSGITGFSLGDRVGLPWLARTCGICSFCRSDRENLCVSPTFTGWDIDGGYAPFVIADEGYVYALPGMFNDQDAAPLLCAGIIGYRALKRAALPSGGRLGIYGFGASAHLATQIAIASGARVHVLTRGAKARKLALELGAESARDVLDRPPEPLDSAILFAPVGSLVLPALAALDRGGTLAIAGIHLSDVPPLNYQDQLFQERTLTSVTANTREDGRDFLATAARINLSVTTTAYPFERVNDALRDLAHGRFDGAAVLVEG